MPEKIRLPRDGALAQPAQGAVHNKHMDNGSGNIQFSPNDLITDCILGSEVLTKLPTQCTVPKVPEALTNSGRLVCDANLLDRNQTGARWGAQQGKFSRFGPCSRRSIGCLPVRVHNSACRHGHGHEQWPASCRPLGILLDVTASEHPVMAWLLRRYLMYGTFPIYSANVETLHDSTTLTIWIPLIGW